MGELPAGTITMLFSDIEGSTALLRRLGDRYADALLAQRALLRAAFADHGGQEQGTEGDSFFVVFGSAADAVRCCVAAQRALSGHAWPDGIPVRVRMGLHSGEPVWHQDEYVGLDVHRAARIMAVAHGGQVVLSEATRQLAGARLPAGASLRDLGLHRLKDIEAPEHIYQLVAAGLPERFPPLKTTLAEAAGPAAAGAAPIVGRVAERQALLAIYARVVARRPQVLLITGAAGIGKTRLVGELCAQAESAAGGARVLLGESAPLAGAALAYGPFVAALRDQAGWMLADDGTPDMLAARHRLFVRVLELLAGLATGSPVVLVLEDLHWADDSSRELLAFLAVRLRDQPVMLVGTLREEELDGGVGQWLAELERRPGVSRLRLRGLADGEIAELVTGLLPADAASADRVAAVVGGNPGSPARSLDESDLGFGGDRLSTQDREWDRGNGDQEAAELHPGLADQALTLVPIAHNLAVLDVGPGPKPVDKPEPPSILQGLQAAFGEPVGRGLVIAGRIDLERDLRHTLDGLTGNPRKRGHRVLHPDALGHNPQPLFQTQHRLWSLPRAAGWTLREIAEHVAGVRYYAEQVGLLTDLVPG